MQELIVILTILTLIRDQSIASCVRYNNTSQGSTYDVQSYPKVINGQKVETDDQSFPYFVSIHFQIKGSLKLTCGGSIINPEIIISAAHCFTLPKAKELTYIRPNYDNLIVPLKKDKYFRVKSIYCHPDDDNGSILHDICLIQLVEPIPFGHGIGPVKLPDKQYLPGSVLTVIGFGGTEYHKISNELRKALLYRQSDKVCKRKYSDHFHQQLMICCLGQNLEDSCRGDSGGPLLDTQTADQHILVGIVAWGLDCHKGWPGVYTNVYHYIDWIKEKVNSLMNGD